MNSWQGKILFLFILLTGFIAWKQTRPVVLRLGLYSGSSWDVPNSRDNTAIDEAIALFESQHPGVDIVYESGIPKEDYSNWLSDQVVQGQQPDLFLVPEEDFSLLASTGALTDLSSFQAKQIEADQFYPVALHAGQYGGKQYALPFESNPIMMCVNKDLLEKEGIELPDANWTLNDFYQIAKEVTKDTDGDGRVDQFGITDYTWQQGLAAHGGQIYDRTNESLTITSDEMRQALNFVTKLDNLSDRYQVSSEDFDQGKVAFYPMSLAQYRTYKPYPYHVAKYSNFAWTCVPMPAVIGTMNATQVQTSLFGVSSKTRHARLAKQFLKTLTTDQQIQQKVFNDSQGISVLRAVMNSQETKDMLRADDFGENSLSVSTLDQMMATAVVEVRFKHYQSILEKADYLLLDAMNRKSIDSDLVEIQKQLENDME
ncbi:ABC transporter substrate-binding protein [Streptococcus cameli]